MKKLLLVLCLTTTNVMALDFETEWAKFDFSKFKKVSKEVIQEKVLPPLSDAIEKVDPKSPDRLGLKLSDSAMVEKMKQLYSKPDTVVYATTIR